MICSCYGSPIIPPYDIDVGWPGRSIKGTPVSLFNGTHLPFKNQVGLCHQKFKVVKIRSIYGLR